MSFPNKFGFFKEEASLVSPYRKVEEAHQVVVGGVQGDVRGCLGEVAVEVVPELWDGKLSWMLRVEVLEYNVKGTAGDT